MNITRHLHWSTDAHAALRETLGEDCASIIRSVEAGRAELYEIDKGGAWIVTTVVDSDLVICCVAGRGLLELGKVFAEIARKNKLTRVRYFSSVGPQLQRLLKRGGWDVREAGRVYHIHLNPVH